MASETGKPRPASYQRTECQCPPSTATIAGPALDIVGSTRLTQSTFMASHGCQWWHQNNHHQPNQHWFLHSWGPARAGAAIRDAAARAIADLNIFLYLLVTWEWLPADVKNLDIGSVCYLLFQKLLKSKRLSIYTSRQVNTCQLGGVIPL